MEGITNFLVVVGKGTGVVVGTLYQSGRQSVDQVIRNILPFMCFIAFVIGLITYTGVGNWVAEHISGLAGSLPGLVVLGAIGGIPVLSPLLGPGAVMAQIIGTLLGSTLIATQRHRAVVCAAGAVRDQLAGWLRLHPGGPGPW